MAEAADDSFTTLKEQSKDPLSDIQVFSGGKPLDLTQEGPSEWDRLGCLCPEHLGEVVSYFCSDCRRSCCTICSMSDHHKHQKSFVDTGEMDEGAFGHTSIFFPSQFTIEGLLRRLNEDLQSVDIRADNAKEEIKACVKRHKDKLESSKKDLVEHVTAVKRARLKYLQEQQKRLRKNVDTLISMVEVMKKHLDSDDHFGILLAEKWLTRRVAELNEKCSKISLPSEQDWNLDKIKVVCDGKYVCAEQHPKALAHGMQGGVRSVHDVRFNAACANVEFEMKPEMARQFVRVCCVELGKWYKLRGDATLW